MDRQCVICAAPIDKASRRLCCSDRCTQKHRQPGRTVSARNRRRRLDPARESEKRRAYYVSNREAFLEKARAAYAARKEHYRAEARRFKRKHAESVQRSMVKVNAKRSASVAVLSSLGIKGVPHYVAVQVLEELDIL